MLDAQLTLPHGEWPCLQILVRLALSLALGLLILFSSIGRSQSVANVDCARAVAQFEGTPNR